MSTRVCGRSQVPAPADGAKIIHGLDAMPYKIRILNDYQELERTRKTMRFNDKLFGWLNEDGLYPTGWNNITRQDLQQHITDLISQEIGYEDAPHVFNAVDAYDAFLEASEIQIGENDAVLSFLIDEGELLSAVSAPTIYAAVNDDDERNGEFVIRVGDCQAPVAVDGATAKLGIMEADISVEQVGGEDNKRFVVTFDTFLKSIDDGIEINFALDTKERPEIDEMSKAKLKQVIKGNGLAELLRTVPSGQSFVKPRDLDVGEYLVISIEENDPHPEYGRSWKILLEGVGFMMTTGKRLNTILANQCGIYIKWLSKGNPLTFAVSKKEELSQGIRVDCGFFKRAPRPVAATQSEIDLEEIDI